jgi:hypothetical protein
VHGLRDDIRMHFIREDDFSFMKALSGAVISRSLARALSFSCVRCCVHGNSGTEREREREREREDDDDDDDGELLRLLDMNISKLTEMEEVAECGN